VTRLEETNSGTDEKCDVKIRTGLVGGLARVQVTLSHSLTPPSIREENSLGTEPRTMEHARQVRARDSRMCWVASRNEVGDSCNVFLSSFFFFNYNVQTQTLTTHTHTYLYEHVYVNSSSMSTSEVLTTRHIWRFQSHHWRLIVVGNTVYHLTRNTDKLWEKIPNKMCVHH
jgi:hypothetical protein